MRFASEAHIYGHLKLVTVPLEGVINITREERLRGLNRSIVNVLQYSIRSFYLPSDCNRAENCIVSFRKIKCSYVELH